MELEEKKLEKRSVSSDTWKKFWTIAGLLFLLHAIIVGALAIFFRPSDNHVILRYNVYFGIDLLGAWWQVYLLPVLSLAFLLANLSFAHRFLKRGEWLLSILL